jgi:hypothetical protein
VKTIRFIMTFAKRYALPLTAAVLSMIGLVALDLVIPLATRSLIHGDQGSHVGSNRHPIDDAARAGLGRHLPRPRRAQLCL